MISANHFTKRLHNLYPTIMLMTAVFLSPGAERTRISGFSLFAGASPADPDPSEAQVRSDFGDGLRTITFDTLYGQVIVKLPDDMAAGDTISGTVIAQARGENEKDKARNQARVDGLVLALESASLPVKQSSFVWHAPEPPANTPARYNLRILDAGRKKELAAVSTEAAIAEISTTPMPAGGTPGTTEPEPPKPPEPAPPTTPLPPSPPDGTQPADKGCNDGGKKTNRRVISCQVSDAIATELGYGPTSTKIFNLGTTILKVTGAGRGVQLGKLLASAFSARNARHLYNKLKIKHVDETLVCKGGDWVVESSVESESETGWIKLYDSQGGGGDNWLPGSTGSNVEAAINNAKEANGCP